MKLNGQEACLVDSGNDKDAGREVRQRLEANGWGLTAIYNTRSTAATSAAAGICRARPGA